MFEKITEFLVEQFWRISPFTILNQYERGVILRLGVYNRSIEAGLYWKWPLLEEVFSVEYVQTTLHVQSQTLTTKDYKAVTISAIIQYEIEDARAFLLDVWEGQDAIIDNVLAAVEHHVSAYEWRELDGVELRAKVLKRVRSHVKPYGVRVKWLAFADRTASIPIRLMGDGESY